MLSGKKFGDYYLGLDMGTDSVGWAVTDPEYNLLRFHSKSMWGSRLFPEAKTAADRRVFRIARRRIKRRNQRLALLQDVFGPEINKVDPSFFTRLQDGMLHAEDKHEKNKNNIFNDGHYDDKQYHKDYPTIYHLRSELIHSKAPHDVRLIYLAIHHIIKYRGHFLFEGSMDSDASFSQIIREFDERVRDTFETEFSCPDPEQMQRVLCDANKSHSDKHKELVALYNCKKDKRISALLKMLAGLQARLTDAFPVNTGEDEIKIDFTGESYDELRPRLEALLGEDYYLLESAKALHDWSILEGTLHGKAYLSDAKVAIYDQHAADLKILKKVIRRYCKDSYKSVFNDPKTEHNYCAYAGVAKINGKKAVIDKCSQEDFLKFISALINKMPNSDPDVQQIKIRLAAGSFMPKLRTKDNSVIPNQLHSKELNAILGNAKEYLPFLDEQDAEGITAAEKIRQILTFRIPYYVGPLNDHDPKAKNTWVVRRSSEKIYPWNFDEIVDRELSASRFITRMTAECTYLKGETVLPQNSLLYSRFMVLNELNNLKLHGEPITVQLKQEIYQDLFMKYKKITLKTLLKYLLSKGYAVNESDITGIDGDFHTTLRSRQEMEALLGEYYDDEAAEKIIHLSTVLGDDRKMLQKKLTHEFKDKLPEALISRAAGKRYTGWGRLSRAFLTQIVDEPDPVTGECMNIITALWETNENLMQLLGRDHHYSESVHAFNHRNEEDCGFTYDIVKDLYVSPSIKRSIWQSLSIVKEIRKVTGHDPQKIFIEMARGGGEKNKRTESRKQKLLKLYQACKEDSQELINEIQSRNEIEFRRDKLYLYYTQMGRCMYTGEAIDLDKIFDKTLYDIDHIYPRSKVKDDSLDNRVLVKRVVNQKIKEDIYPINKEIREKMHSFWAMLLAKDLISKAKYERLVRSTPLTTDELTAFIARQLVETRQGTKAVAELLQKLMPQTEIVYVKAGLVSDFRQDFDMLKCREVNDMHHAKDAYLNIVVGNVYNTKFTKDPRNFFLEQDHQYSLNKMYDYDVRRGKNTAWIRGDSGSIATVKRMMRKNNVLVTRMSYDQKGQLFDNLPVKKGKWQLPIKQGPEYFSDNKKYGGYKNVKGSYFMLVEHKEKGKVQRSVINMPIHMIAYAKDKEIVQKLLEKENCLEDPRIIIPHLKVNALIEIDQFRMYLTSRSNDSLLYAPAQQLIVGYDWEKYIRNVAKLYERSSEYSKQHRGQTITVTEYDGVTKEQNLALYDLFVHKLETTLYRVRLATQAKNLKKARDTFEMLPITDQCYVLLQILNLFASNRTTADFKLLKLSGRSGTISTNNNITNYQTAKIIYQSITGLFEKEKDLLV